MSAQNPPKASFTRRPKIPTPQTFSEKLLWDALAQSNAYGRNISIAFGIQGVLLLIALICLFASKI